MAIILAAQNGNWSSTSTWTGGIVPSSGDIAVINNKSVTIDVDVICNSIIRDTTGGATAGGGITVNPNRTINANINANNTVSGNFTFISCSLSAGQTFTLNGNILCGGNCCGAAYGVGLSGTGGTFNINGNINGSINSPSLYINSNNATVNIVGNVGFDTFGIGTAIYIASTATVNITGNIYNPGGAGILTGASGYTINIIGNIYTNKSGTASAIGIANSGTLNITGNIYTTNSTAVNIQSNSTTNVTGNIYGNNNSTTLYGLIISSIATVNVTGSCIGGDASPALVNNASATCTITRAVGNGFGPGSVGKVSAVGVSSAQTARTYVYQIEYGTLGQSPTSGPIELVGDNSNVAVFAVRLSAPKTLVDLNNATNLVPSSGNVRSGVSYNYGNNTGSCVIPHPNSVVYGVPVDNTIGSGLLSPVAVWNALTSSIGTSGSIGERLKNVSTVATVGKQFEGVL